MITREPAEVGGRYYDRCDVCDFKFVNYDRDSWCDTDKNDPWSSFDLCAVCFVSLPKVLIDAKDFFKDYS